MSQPSRFGLRSVQQTRADLRRCGGVLSLLVILLLLGASAYAGPKSAANAGATQAAPTNAGSSVDVGILVLPESAAFDSATVAVGYRHPVPHDRVKQAVAKLGQQTGWAVSGLQIVDDRINRDPVTTTAKFTLRHAPQMPGGFPALRPYLQAFQAENRVEVLFDVWLPQYRGMQQFDSSALSIRLMQGQAGLIYDADIHDHHGVLPALPMQLQNSPTGASPATPPAAVARQSALSAFNAAFLLVVIGVALAGGSCVYVWLMRRLPARSSARVLRF